MLKKSYIINLFLLLVLSFLLQGCAVIRLFKADEAPNYGFVPNPKWLKAMPESSPFNKNWVTKKRTLYSKLKTKNLYLYIAPIKTDIIKKTIKENVTVPRLSQDRLEELEQVVSYFHENLKLTLEKFPKHPLKLADRPGPATFELHLSLVELHPTNPAINALGTAAGFFVPGGGLIKVIGKGEVAIEGYLLDSVSKVVLEQFKDREIDRAAPFSVKDFQQYAHIRSAIDDWSKQLIEITAKPVGEAVEDSLPFSINPF